MRNRGLTGRQHSIWYTTEPPAVNMIGFNSLDNDLPYVHANATEGPYVVLPLTFRDPEFSKNRPSVTTATWMDASSVSLSREAVGLIRRWTDQVRQDRSNTLWAHVLRDVLSQHQVVISVEEFTMNAESLEVRNALVLTYAECVRVNCNILRNAWAKEYLRR